ncbi:MAG: sulfotransferase [Chthoniobacterales bacterium]|nr:sulfotransferase [Chthoniobacterales bacterium]
MKQRKRVILVLGVPRSGMNPLARGLETMSMPLTRIFHTNHLRKPGSQMDTALDFNQFNRALLYNLKKRRRLLLALTPEEVTFLCQKVFLSQAIELLNKKTSSSSLVVIKDPLFSLFLPFWKKVFQVSKISFSCVISLRNPRCVVESTIDAHKLFKIEHKEKLFWKWISYLLSSLEHSQGFERVLVDYEELLKDPSAQLQRIAHQLDLIINQEALEKYCHDFIDSSLCHCRRSKKEPCTESLEQQLSMEMYEKLFQVAKDESPFQEIDLLYSKWKKQFRKAYSLLVLVEKNDLFIEELQQTLIDRQKIITELNKTITKNSVLIANYTQQSCEQQLKMASLQEDRRIQNHAILELKNHIERREHLLSLHKKR